MMHFLYGAAAWIAGGFFIKFFGRSFDIWRRDNSDHPEFYVDPRQGSPREYDIIAVLVAVGGLIWLIITAIRG